MLSIVADGEHSESTAGAALCQPRASKCELHEHLCCPGFAWGGGPSAEPGGTQVGGHRPRPKPAAAGFGLGHVALGNRIDRSTDQAWAPRSQGFDDGRYAPVVTPWADIGPHLRCSLFLPK